MQVCNSGRYASRDIGGSDPERMAPPRVAEYVESLFSDADSAVTVTITQGHSTFEADYPLLAAVNRACKGSCFYIVERTTSYCY